ncbi:hypothetical protein ABIC45_003474 [Mucilaginibacter rubeus]
MEAKKLKSVSKYLKDYHVYSGTADLSIYFFERGVNLCKEFGIISYINTNKFFNTGYGKPLRSFILNNEIKQLINFEQVEVFEGVLVSSVIVNIKRNKPKTDNTFQYQKFYNLKHKDFITKFVDGFQKKQYYQQANLTNKEWSFSDNINLSVKSKIEAIATQLSMIEGVSIYRGVTTGFNPAFIIDNKKKRELIEQDVKNEPLIKPLLQGRNIRKWIYNKGNENLLFIPWHFPLNNNIEIKGNSDKAEICLKREYRVLFDHLFQYHNELSNRNKEETGIRYEWYALQRCAASYHEEFDRNEKIIWGLTADKWAFAYDSKQNYLPSNGYILTSNVVSIKYLLALLNSQILKYYFGFIGVMTAGGAYTLKHSTIQQLPIIVADNPKPIVDIVDQILSEKNIDPLADVSSKERILDKLICNLYQLSDDEIDIIFG